MQIRNEKGKNIHLERLLFRRQYLLGYSRFKPNKYWSYTRLLRGLHLSVHIDLPYCSASRSDTTLTLIGIAIDCRYPMHSESDILHSLLSKTSDIDALIDSTYSIGGRWVIILQNQCGTFLFADPCGFRQVFYHYKNEKVWCASQPELIRANRQMRLSNDTAFVSFITDPIHARQESANIGTNTLYENCYHLLPNHYLKLEAIKQTRFYPRKSIEIRNNSEIVETSCKMLRAVIKGLAERYDVAMALTAGWDTRVLLAASKPVCNKIEYFVYVPSLGGEGHPDVWVPKDMARELGIKFVVKRPENEVPGWFVSILSQNVACARVLPKTCHIYNKLISGDNKININGNGSEICRNVYDKYCEHNIRENSTELLSTKMFGQKALPTLVIREIDEWKRGFNFNLFGNMNLLDFLYWEQRLGNWGSQFPAEQDIAVEEISPFNCRLFIETLLSSPRNQRSAPDYPLYKDLIRRMWPETLSFPINPRYERKFVDELKHKIRPKIPKPMIRLLRRIQLS
jgi:hypothetical protein